MDKKDIPKMPKVFLGRAYLKECEKGVYGLYRDLVTETDQTGLDGDKIREKVKSIGPLKLLREAAKDEDTIVVMRTVHPDSGRDLALVELS